MTNRQIVLAIIGLLIALACFFLAKNLIDSKSPPPRNEAKQGRKLVRVMEAQNTTLRPQTDLLVSLSSRNKIELFTEVNGRLLDGGKEFREGQRFNKGEAMLRLDTEEQRMNLLAQKTAFLNLITSVLPDLKLDFPDNYEAWENYVLNFNEEKPLPPLPEALSKQEKFFLASRNIPNQFYTIKSAEARLDKYILRAPFDGVVLLSSVNPGALVRTGQKVGEFVGEGSFEAEGGVDAEQVSFISMGDSVSFESKEYEGSWTGKVIRIADVIDPATQTVKVYCSIKEKGLKDGMYFNATIHSAPVENALRIDRSLLTDGSQLFAVKDSVLKLLPVDIVRRGVRTALVKGIPDGTVLLSESVNNAYEGMEVTPTE